MMSRTRRTALMTLAAVAAGSLVPWPARSQAYPSQTIKRQFAAAGIEPAGAGPEEYGQALKRESERVAKVVQAAGIKPQ